MISLNYKVKDLKKLLQFFFVAPAPNQGNLTGFDLQERRKKADAPLHDGVDPGTAELVTKSAESNARGAGAPRGLRLGRLEAQAVPVEAIVNPDGGGGQRPEQAVVKQAERAAVGGAAGWKARERARHQVPVVMGEAEEEVAEVARKVHSSTRLWESDATGGQKNPISQHRVGPAGVQRLRQPRLRRTVRRLPRLGRIRYVLSPLLVYTIPPAPALALR